MRIYKLTLKDKIYLFFHEDEEKRMNYLFSKVKKYQLKWFKKNELKIPLFFDRYVENYVDNLLLDYDLRR